ncbi:unnamed protein product [Parnassius apollo]|uniref:(apollo) hypothetical protein n=1 Tax=Parnassius apollo TaxID=110799 RepID=A0A8S3X6S4_PARAO|nr:unnamed protein product [Parnassius apollo]
MSYDKDLMANSSLGKAWRAANDQLSKSEYENINLTMVCEELDNWVANDSLNLRRSLSLSASSILVHGACRFYRDETDKLLKDASKLSQQIMLSHYQSDASSSEDDDESFDTDETREYKTEDTSTILQRKRPMETDNRSKQTKRVKLDAQSNSTKSNSDNDGSDHNLDGVVRGSTHLVEECNVPSNSNLEVNLFITIYFLDVV